MTEEKKSGPRMLRMVRFKGILQDAERLRAPMAQNRHEALSRIIHMGDPQTARQALAYWYKEELERLETQQPPATREQGRVLLMDYLEMKGKIGGRMTVMDTEIGYYSQNVAPDYGKVTHTYEGWATPPRLRRIFNEGNEIIIQGHVGTGKTHLAVLFMEALLALKAGYHVISNVSGIQDPTGRYASRIHYISRLSEILQAWAELPPDTPILLVIDEPEANLKGGNTKGVNNYAPFRYMIRKLGMAKIEIWHSEGEQYKSLREDDSDGVFRIFKDQQNSFQITETVRGESITQRIERVNGLEVLSYATKGMASITPDVDMSRLLDRIAKLYVQQEMKDSVRDALQNPRYYLETYGEDEAAEEQEAKRKQKLLLESAENEAFIQKILASPQDYLGKGEKGFDRDVISRVFGVADGRARQIALAAWRRHKPKDPVMAALEPEDQKIVEAILARSSEFLTPSGRGFDREKVCAAFGVSQHRARLLVREAWKRRHGAA